MEPADHDVFSVRDELNEPLDPAATELRAVLGFPPPTPSPAQAPALAPVSRLEPAPRTGPDPMTGPLAQSATGARVAPEDLEAVIEPLVEQVAAISDRLASLEARYSDPSALLEEVDRKLEKLMDAGRRVERAADSARSSVRDVQLDDIRLQILDLRSGIEHVTRMLFG